MIKAENTISVHAGEVTINFLIFKTYSQMTVRLDRIYTKKGDKGTTQSIGGARVSKGSISIECYGMLDELSSHLGIVRSLVVHYKDTCKGVAEETERVFKKLQNDLFDLGCVLPRPLKKENTRNNNLKGKNEQGPDNFNKRVEFLENLMDGYLKDLNPLNSFVLSGGGLLSAQVHLTRAVARRFERLLVRWHESDKIQAPVLAYVNRLSDFLFVYARWVTKQLGEDEYLWEPA